MLLNQTAERRRVDRKKDCGGRRMKIIIFYGGSQDGRFLFINELPPEICIPIAKGATAIGAEVPHNPGVFPEIKVEVYEHWDDYRYVYSEKKSG